MAKITDPTLIKELESLPSVPIPERITSQRITPPPPTLTEMYKESIAQPATEALAGLLSPAAWRYRLSHPLSADPTEARRQAGAIPKFVAGMAVPQSPALASLYALGPAIGNIGKASTVAPTLGKSLLNIAARTGATTAAGAGVSKLTGESPLKGGAEGLLTGLGGEAVRKLIGPQRKVYLSEWGYNFMNKYLRPGFVKSVSADVPILEQYLSKGGYPWLQNLQDKRVFQEVGKKLYDPVRSDLSKLDVTVTFPNLVRGRWRNNPLPPEIMNVLPSFTAKVLKPISRQTRVPPLVSTAAPVTRSLPLTLPPDRALRVVQELKDLGYQRSRDDIIGKASRDLATEMQDILMRTVDRVDKSIVPRLKDANLQYSKLKGLGETISSHANDLFPRTGGGKVGFDPSEWATALTKGFENMPERLFPHIRGNISFGGELGAGALTSGHEGIMSRIYSSVPWFHFGVPLGRVVKTVTLPRQVGGSMAVWPRALLPAAISGAEYSVEPTIGP